VTTNVTTLLHPAPIQPNDTTSDDRDVYLEISTLAHKCTPLIPQFLHVKGHQDQKAKRLLTIWEQYNIDCDERAKRYTCNAAKSSTALGNPAIPIAQPHLIIGRKIICRSLTKTLQDATSVPPYLKYMKEKWNWMLQETKNIHWTILSHSMSHFTNEDQRRLILFIHNKLPLRASKAHPHMGSNLCPSCQCKNETSKHFLECQHHQRSKLFAKLKQDLSAITQRFQLHPCIFTAIWLGLTSIRTNEPYPDILDNILHQLIQPIQLQTKMGWEQLFHGRLSTSWALAIDAIHPNLAITGEQILINWP